MTEICDVDSLEATVGGRPLGVMMKSIDELDDHCRSIVARSTALVVADKTSDGAMRAIATHPPQTR